MFLKSTFITWSVLPLANFVGWMHKRSLNSRELSRPLLLRIVYPNSKDYSLRSRGFVTKRQPFCEDLICALTNARFAATVDYWASICVIEFLTKMRTANVWLEYLSFPPVKWHLYPPFRRKHQELTSMNEQYLQALSLYQRLVKFPTLHKGELNQI